MTKITLVHRNSLSCEAIVREVQNGDFLLVSQCDGLKEPAPENRVYFWHSKDKGRTWGNRQLLWPEDGRAVYQTEVSVIGNEITVFITLHNGFFFDWNCVIMKSHDNGYTWHEAGPPPVFDTFVFFRGLIQTFDNTLILPYQRYPVTPELNRQLKDTGLPIHKHIQDIPYNENGVLRSEDGGLSWKAFPAVTLLHEQRFHWGEPTVCELNDHSLVMLLRVNHSGYLWRSDSKDGGKSWCDAYQTDIPNPNNKPKLLKLPNGDIALLNTPSALSNPLARWSNITDRHPLALWISSDDMKTWRYKRDLITMPGAISYPDGFCSADGKHIYLAIEFNRHDIYFIDHEIEE